MNDLDTFKIQARHVAIGMAIEFVILPSADMVLDPSGDNSRFLSVAETRPYHDDNQRLKVRLVPRTFGAASRIANCEDYIPFQRRHGCNTSFR